MNAARSLQAKSTTRAMSSGTPARPSGLSAVRVAMSSPAASSGASCSVVPGVVTNAGATPSTRMSRGPNSMASALVVPTSACFDVM